MNTGDVAGLRIGSEIPDAPGGKPLEPWELHMHCLEPLLWTYAMREGTDFFDPIGNRIKIEELPPAVAFSHPYWERHLIAMLAALHESNVVMPHELKTAREVGYARMTRGAAPSDLAVTAEQALRSATTTASRPTEAAPPRFRVGDDVEVVRMNPTGHTRCPAYVRGKAGVVADDLGPHRIFDARLLSDRGPMQHAYTVRFTGDALWGIDGHPNDLFEVDLFDDFLQHAA